MPSKEPLADCRKILDYTLRFSIPWQANKTPATYWVFPENFMKSKSRKLRVGPPPSVSGKRPSGNTGDSLTNDHSRNEMPFAEAIGKTIAFINLTNDPPDWQDVEIHFTDGTFLSFELILQLRIKAEYQRFKNGELQMLADYGILPTEEEKTEESP